MSQLIRYECNIPFKKSQKRYFLKYQGYQKLANNKCKLKNAQGQI